MLLGVIGNFMDFMNTTTCYRVDAQYNDNAGKVVFKEKGLFRKLVVKEEAMKKIKKDALLLAEEYKDSKVSVKLVDYYGRPSVVTDLSLKKE